MRDVGWNITGIMKHQVAPLEGPASNIFHGITDPNCGPLLSKHMRIYSKGGTFHFKSTRLSTRTTVRGRGCSCQSSGRRVGSAKHNYLDPLSSPIVKHYFTCRSSFGASQRRIAGWATGIEACCHLCTGHVSFGKSGSRRRPE